MRMGMLHVEDPGFEPGSFRAEKNEQTEDDDQDPGDPVQGVGIVVLRAGLGRAGFPGRLRLGGRTRFCPWSGIKANGTRTAVRHGQR